MTNKDLVEYLFKGFVSVVLFLALIIFNGFNDSIDKMQESINTLNINFASFSEKLISSGKERARLEKRIEKLEDIKRTGN